MYYHGQERHTLYLNMIYLCCNGPFQRGLEKESVGYETECLIMSGGHTEALRFVPNRVL
jgi:hypothetical protein